MSERNEERRDGTGPYTEDATCDQCGIDYRVTHNAYGAVVAQSHWSGDLLCVLRQRDALRQRVAELTNLKDRILLEARIWSGEAKGHLDTVRQVGSVLGGVPSYGPIVDGVRALRERAEAAETQRDALAGALRRLLSEFAGTKQDALVLVEEDGERPYLASPDEGLRDAVVKAHDALSATPKPATCKTYGGQGITGPYRPHGPEPGDVCPTCGGRGMICESDGHVDANGYGHAIVSYRDCPDCGGLRAEEYVRRMRGYATPDAERERTIHDEIGDELRRARSKFPDAGGCLAALTEEVGELAKAVLSESAERVREEGIQVATMAIRVMEEGDSTLDPYRTKQGLAPLARATGGDDDA